MTTPDYDRRLAVRFALVNLHVDLDARAADDRAVACEANGWQMSDASDLYDRAIDTIVGLLDGTVDATEYLTTGHAVRYLCGCLEPRCTDHPRGDQLTLPLST